MSAPTRTPRSKWIEQGLWALAAGGPDAVRIEPLARALGVTRGGFYWHFDDRRALLDEMLDTWERTTTEAVIERLDSEAGDVEAPCLLAFSLLIGNHFIAANHGARSRADVVDMALRRLGAAGAED